MSEQNNKPEVHLWSTSLDADKLCLAKCEELLSPEELSRRGSFVRQVDGQYYAMGRAFLRVVLSYYIGGSPQDIEILYNNQNKPYIKNNPIYFNVSHSNELYCLAISPNCKVGIDVAHYENIDNAQSFLNSFSNSNERSMFSHLKPDSITELILKIWTAKEAFVKGIGKGFMIEPQSVELKFSDGNIAKHTLTVELDKEVFSNWKIRCWEENNSVKTYFALAYDSKHDVEIIDKSRDRELHNQVVSLIT